MLMLPWWSVALAAVGLLMVVVGVVGTVVRQAKGQSEARVCRVYWGSHGCDLMRGHRGPHVCQECWNPDDTDGYVGSWPYYGPDTKFYGEDVSSTEKQHQESGTFTGTFISETTLGPSDPNRPNRA